MRRSRRSRPFAFVTLGLLGALAVGAVATGGFAPAGIATSGATSAARPTARDAATGTAVEVPLAPAAGSAGVRLAAGRLRLVPGSGRTVRTTRPGVVRHPAYLGVALLAPVRLPDPTGSVTVDTAGTRPHRVAASVRTRTPHGWSEWTPAALDRSTTLPAAGDRVQVRLVLTAPDAAHRPTVDRVTLTPGAPARATTTDRAAHSFHAKVYATREGLVGGTTANGHEIVDDDHFVALPSPRALSGAGKGEYSVRVCTEPDHPDSADRRCAWAPVWDVGPWNKDDDHWSPADVRERFADLRRGLPEAQAAYEDHYHDGKDGYGRAVSNPAGIDLADGTFRGDLGLEDNAWVDVRYLWTGGPGTATVDAPAGADGSVAVRAGADRSAHVVGGAADHAGVVAHCAEHGSTVDGPHGSSATWYLVGTGMYLPKAYLRGAGDVRGC